MESASHVLVTAASRAVTAKPDFTQTHFHERAHVVQQQFVGLLPWIRRAAHLLLVLICLLLSSLATYGLFYMVVMPSNQCMKPLFFDYSGYKPAFQSQCVFPEESTCTTGDQHDDEQRLPTATVDLFAMRTPWEAFEQEVTPQHVTKDRLLRVGHAYFVELVLLMPETERNRLFGMFSIEVELRSNDTVLARSTRSARFPFESRWVGVIRKLLLIIPLMLGALEENRKVVISPFDNFIESAKHPLQHVVVKLAVPPTSSYDSRHVEVVSGDIRIGRELNEFQRVLKHWFFTCYMLGTLLILSVKVILWFLFQFLLSARSQTKRSPEPEQQQGRSESHASEWEPFTDEEMDDNEWDDMPTNGLQETQQEAQTAESVASSSSAPQESPTDGPSGDSSESGVSPT